jgi:hypothetical protein
LRISWLAPGWTSTCSALRAYGVARQAKAQRALVDCGRHGAVQKRISQIGSGGWSWAGGAPASGAIGWRTWTPSRAGRRASLAWLVKVTSQLGSVC